MTDTKSYPGIPAGICDENMEKHMSERKRPFDAAIVTLNYYHPFKNKPAKQSIRAAIRLLKAAGKVDKEKALWNLDEAFSEGREHVSMMAPYKQDHNLEEYNRAEKEITALVESLPDGGKK